VFKHSNGRKIRYKVYATELFVLPPFLFTSRSEFGQRQTLSSLTKNIGKNINNHNTKYIQDENIAYGNSSTIDLTLWMLIFFS
jgi:hypothetical protein